MRSQNYSIFETHAISQIVIYVIATSTIFSIIFFSERYLHISREVYIGWGLLCLAFVLNKVQSFKQVPGRIIFIFITGYITLRYFLWRTFDTLVYTGPYDLIGMLSLYLAECYAITIHFLGMFVNVWPLERGPAIPLPDDISTLPTVDIFIPTYNEDEEIVKLTATAATQIDYPKEKLRIHILDDGSTVAKRNKPETQESAWKRYYSFKRMAKELGANYLTRERNDHAKAGNLNHALTETNGDLILVLDCDHVPTRDILKNTVAYFLKDEKLFLVQTPHFFVNPTTVEKNIGSFSNSPRENDMFYNIIHRGMDLWNSSYFCGSAALLRRKCLMENNGITGETITEDAETSLQLHNRGYNSLYVRRPMVCGLSPETFDDYIIQRTRWAQGMMQIFILTNPLLAKGLTIAQRICYLNSCFFWFFSIARFIFYISPALFLILGLRIYHASTIQIIAFALPHVLSAFIVMEFFYGNVRRRFFSEIYESVQTIFLMPAIFSVMLNPRKPVFKITPKGKGIENESINPMATPFFLIGLINIAAMPFAVYKWFYLPLFRGVVLVGFLWCAYNLLLALITLGAFLERRQIRRYHRVPAHGEINLFVPGLNQTIEGKVEDMSLTGISIELILPDAAEPAPLSIEDEICLKASDSYGDRYEFKGKIKSYRKRREKTFCGIEFALDETQYTQLVKFVYGDSQRWVDLLRERDKPVSLGSSRDLYYFLIRGIKVSWDCFIYLKRLLFPVIKMSAHMLFPRFKTSYLKMERRLSL